MSSPLPLLALGAVAIGALALSSKSASAAPPATGGGASPPPAGGTAPADGTIPPIIDKAGVPSTIDGKAARRGVASNPAFQWLYVVRSGDNPSSITKHIVGDDRRFPELIQANPSKSVVGNAANPYSSGYNFASLNPDERILVPKAWNSYIDEQGYMLGKVLPPAPPRV